MKSCPRNPRHNIRYRRELIEASSESDEFKSACWHRARGDIVWFVNTFGWTYSPKEFPDAPNRPFILWDYQEEAVLKLNSAIGKHDLLIEKSRDMGASWLCISVFLWRWMFYDRQSFLVGSRKQELVDKTGDPKSLFWKIEYFLRSMPGWMLPRYTRTSMHLYNNENGSTIDGESTNDDFARGDRRSAILLDEFPAVVDNGHNILAATRDATNCRIFNGTPQGSSGAYYDTRQAMAKNNPDWLLRMHWTLHPMKKKGMYTTFENKPNERRILLDRNYRHKPDYNFILDGKVRSPWYDVQCVRAAHAQEIAQELDIDYAASGWQYFDSTVLDLLVREMSKNPSHVGELSYEGKGTEARFDPDLDGRLQLWCQLDGRGNPNPGEYVVGIDVATGKGGEMSSNSVACVADRKTGNKVAQFTGNTIDPKEFAVYCQAIGRFFKNLDGSPAMLIWEENGPGMELSKKVRDDGYANIYIRDTESALYRRKVQKAGWYSTAETKRILLSDYKAAIMAKEYWNPCKEALLECGEYVHRPSVAIEHSRSRGTTDPTATGENHGDMVIADALAYRGIKDRGGVVSSSVADSSKPSPPPFGSFGYRRKEYEKSLARVDKY